MLTQVFKFVDLGLNVNFNRMFSFGTLFVFQTYISTCKSYFDAQAIVCLFQIRLEISNYHEQYFEK